MCAKIETPLRWWIRKWSRVLGILEVNVISKLGQGAGCRSGDRNWRGSGPEGDPTAIIRRVSEHRHRLPDMFVLPSFYKAIHPFIPIYPPTYSLNITLITSPPFSAIPKPSATRSTVNSPGPDRSMRWVMRGLTSIRPEAMSDRQVGYVLR